MTKKQIETAFDQHQKLLHSLSHQVSRRCGRPEDECYGQACYLFMQATQSFDPSKSEFVTWLYTIVHNGLVQWGKKNDLPTTYTSRNEDGGDRDDLKPKAAFNEGTTNLNPEKLCELNDWLEHLSTEVKEVVAVILNSPAEILEFGGDNFCKITSQMLSRWMRSKGWGWIKTRATINELKLTVSRM